MRKETVRNPRYPHRIHIVRKVVSDWLDDDRRDRFITVYYGPGRSYTDTTTTGDAKADTNRRKCSIPMRFDAWKRKAGDTLLIPMSGDIVYVTKGDIREQWEVKDFEPDNDRSVVYGEMNRTLHV